MKHVKTLNTNTLKNSMKKGGCGECQTSCQSACKTSCTVGIRTDNFMKTLGSMLFIVSQHKRFDKEGRQDGPLRSLT